MYDELEHINNTDITNLIAAKLESFYSDNSAELIASYNKVNNHDALTTCYVQVDDESIIDDLCTKADIIILTTSSFERKALHYQFYSKNTSRKISVINIRLYPQLGEEPVVVHGYFFKWGNYNILHIESAEKEPYMFGGSNDIFRFVINNKYLTPTACISLGICKGTPNSVYHIGDTIISNRIYPYFVSQSGVKANYFTSDNDIFRLSYSISNQLKQKIFETGLVSKESLGFDVQMGNYVTGDYIIYREDNQNYFNFVSSHQISAISPEGYGMYKECRGWNCRIPCIIIKTMYEYAITPDLNKTSIDIRFIEKGGFYNSALASFHSAIVLEILLENDVFGKTIPKLIQQRLQPLRKEDIHVIKYEELEDIISCVLKDKYHSETYAFSLSNQMLERLREENVIGLIIDENDGSEMEYVSIIETVV